MKAHRALCPLLVCAALAAFAAGAVSAETAVDRTVAADPGVEIEIEIVSGELVLRSWDRAEVRITGTLGDDVEELQVEGGGDRISIEIELPDDERRSRYRRDLDAELEITVPTGASIDAETISAPITAVGLRGQLDLESVSGDIEVADAASRLDLETVSGSIRVRRSPVPVDAETVSGAVDLEQVGARVDAASVSGRVRVETGELERLEAESVSGSVEISAALARGGRLDVSSHSGNVDVRLPGDTAAAFELSTYSGSIANELGPEAQRESRWVPAQSVNFSTGGGGGKVTIESFSGNIRLRRR